MIGIQLLAILFVLWMTYFSYLHYRRREYSIWEYALWQMLWIGLAFVALRPHSVDFLLRSLKIPRAFDLVTMTAIVILFGITFRSYVILKRMEKRIEKFTRTQALDKSQP